MTLKIHINGTSKKLVTPLRTFVNGNLKRLSKGFTFVNGEKKQLWGNTRTQFFSIPFGGGFDNDILYIDDSYMYTYGTTFSNITNTQGGSAVVSKSNCLCIYSISNPSSATRVSWVQWGAYPIFSPSESDSSNYIFYMSSSNTRNKVLLKNDSTASVVSTYTGPSGMNWSVQLANGKNLWTKTSNSVLYLGYNSTTVTSTNVPTYPIAWDGGDVVVGSMGVVLDKGTISGTGVISNNTYVTSKVMDGDYVFVAGYKTTSATTATKVARYNVTNAALEWEVVFQDDRRPDVIGVGSGKYYVVDKPKDFNSSDTNVYLRIYDVDDGTELESTVLDYRTESDAKIIGWKTTPVRAVNGVLPMRWYNSSKMYICKIFVD